MTRILVVCTGNICRSPLIERALQSGLDQAYGAGAVEVRSAGTYGMIDSPMDERAAAVLHEMGGDPTGFLGRRLSAALLPDVDLVLTATRQHRAVVVQMRPKALRSAFTVRELAHLSDQMDPATLPTDPGERLRAVAAAGVTLRSTNALLDPEDLDVVDPYRRSDETYAQMRRQLEPALQSVLRVLLPAGGSAQQDASDIPT